MNFFGKCEKIDNEPLIQAAVDYWATFLVSPSMDVGSPASGEAALFELLARKHSQRSLSPKVVDKFKDIFAEKIRRQIRMGVTSVITKTDYGPEGMLGDALQESGALGVSFPGKASVRINVKEGTVEQWLVGSETITLYDRVAKDTTTGRPEVGEATKRLGSREGLIRD